MCISYSISDDSDGMWRIRRDQMALHDHWGGAYKT